MKNFLSNYALPALVALGVVGYHFVSEAREENKQRFAIQHSNENACMQALRTAVLPTAQKAPHFLELDVWPQGTSREGDSGAVVHVAGRVVTLDNSRSLSTSPNYSMTCLIKDGVVASNVVTPTP